MECQIAYLIQNCCNRGVFKHCMVGRANAHAVSNKKTSMSLAFTVSAISSWDVRNMFQRTAWICSNIAFDCGFLTLVGLCFIPYVLHRGRKWSLNLLPLLYIKYQQYGYLLNQVLYTKLLIWAELLSKVVSATVAFLKMLPFYLPAGGTVVTRLTVGSSTISNHLVVGLIMVRRMKSIVEPSCPLRV